MGHGMGRAWGRGVNTRRVSVWTPLAQLERGHGPPVERSARVLCRPARCVECQLRVCVECVSLLSLSRVSSECTSVCVLCR